MTELKVKTSTSYSVILDKNLSEIGKEIKKNFNPETIAIFTDTNVEKLYLNSVVLSLKNEGFNVVTKVIPSGEKYKNFDTYFSMIDFLASCKLTRNDMVLSLGGGVVSDLGGFTASSYLRGVKHVIVPTTLLSIIDASIGGKTGFDIKQGKNLVGAFYEPSLVYIDLNVLKTLPTEEVKSGLGEGIKYGLLLGGRCFDILENGLNESNFTEFVTLCVKCKIDICEKDEKESGQRKLLNLGHTFGHAIEQASNYAIPHGVCVGLGIDRVLKYSNLSNEDKTRVKNLLNKYHIYDYKYQDINVNEFLQIDKKRTLKNEISLIVVEKIGDCRIVNYNISEL